MAVDLGGVGSGFLDKIEEYWGKAVVRGVTLLIGLALAAVCLGAIWQWLVSPLLDFFQTPLWGRTVTQLAFIAMAIGGGVAVGLLIFSALGQWRQFRLGKRRLNEMDKRLNALLRRATTIGERADQSIEHSSTLLEGIILVMHDQLEKIPADVRDSYRAQLEEAEKHLASVKERDSGFGDVKVERFFKAADKDGLRSEAAATSPRSTAPVITSENTTGKRKPSRRAKPTSAPE